MNKVMKLNLKPLYFLFLGMLIAFGANAQIKTPSDNGPVVKKDKTDDDEDDDEGGFDKRRLFTGGGFGLSLGRTTYVECSPNLGYKVTDRFWPGLGFNYQYWQQKDATGAIYKQNILGWRAYGSYQIFESIVGYAEYESLQVNYLGQEIFMNNTWAGLGFRQWIGSGSAIDALILRNLNYGPNTIQQAFYPSPWNIKMSLIIGFN